MDAKAFIIINDLLNTDLHRYYRQPLAATPAPHRDEYTPFKVFKTILRIKNKWQ